MWETLGVKELPPHLYHYTSIETLALILRGRTIRFSRLDGVNDPEEATASDLKNASSLVFASCWTDESQESLAMWKLYTPDMQGVRLRFPSNPFAGRHAPTIMDKGGAMQCFDGEVTVNRVGPAPGTKLRYVIGPNKVFYTDDPAYRNRRCLYEEGDGIRVYLHDLGMAKNSYWAFEKEWRYMLRATNSEMVYRKDPIVEEVLLDLEAFPVKEGAVYVPLDPSCFDELEVVLGPRVSYAQTVIVETLLMTYAPTSKVIASRIKVR